MARQRRAQVQGIRFSIGDLISEADCILMMGYRFIERQSYRALEAYRDSIYAVASARSNTMRRVELGVIQTQCADIRGRSVYARIRGNWEVTPVSERSKKVSMSREIAFSGIASTRIELFQYGSQERAAMWRIEIGSEGSPGCYFHVQVLGDSDDMPFPKTIEIPRLPSFFVTPMSAVDYTLGELFGTKWAQKIATSRVYGSQWCKLQRRLLQSQIKWYGDVIRDSKNPSWMSIKAAVPGTDLFLLDR